MNLLTIVILLALAATVLSLAFGLRSMSQGEPYDHERSGRFMTMRVVFQGVAVALLIAALFMTAR